jgi:hypothetical protein
MTKTNQLIPWLIRNECYLICSGKVNVSKGE